MKNTPTGRKDFSDYPAVAQGAVQIQTLPLMPSLCDNVDWISETDGAAVAASKSSNTRVHLTVNPANHGELGPRHSSTSSLLPLDTVPSPDIDDQAVSTSVPANAFFPHASNFNVNQPTMIEVHGIMHQYLQQRNMDPSILKEMQAKYVTLEAEFDSSDREDAPKCHPGTRSRFLDELKSRIQSRTRIIWLFGPAGVGKSAIMQTLAETLAPSVICLSFFFSRPNSHDDPNKVFPTLGYRLSTVVPGYRRYLEDKLAIDPFFLAKTLEEQFKRLFVNPLARNPVDTLEKCVVFLDGLDEANGSNAQCRILDLIQSFVQSEQTSNIPICWVIASRPEPHLQTSFSRISKKVPGDFWKLEVPIDSDEAAREVEIYIRAAFLTMKEDFADVVPPRWPPEADLLKVTTASSGLFVFATTSMGFVGDQNPVLRLKHLVGLIDHYRENSRKERPTMKKNPFELLDTLYRTIIDNIPDESFSTTRSILGFYLLGKEVVGNPALIVACKILEHDQSEVYAALRGLQSVLWLPPQEDLKSPLRFLHASFSDFLKDKSRSGVHGFDMGEEIKRVWWCYVKVFRQLLKTMRPELIQLGRGDFDELTYDGTLSANLYAYNVFEMLETHCHALPCDCGLSYHLVLDTAELLDVFREFCPFLYRGVLIEGPHQMEGWLFSNHYLAPHAFLEQIYRQEMTLDQFNESDFDCIFRALSIGRPAYYDVFSALSTLDVTNLTDVEWRRIKCTPPVIRWTVDDMLQLPSDWTVLGTFMHLNETDKAKYDVKIFGIEKEYLWVLIDGSFCSDERECFCVILPYVKTDDIL